jgi:hypothetical protein
MTRNLLCSTINKIHVRTFNPLPNLPPGGKEYAPNWPGVILSPLGEIRKGVINCYTFTIKFLFLKVEELCEKTSKSSP